MEVGESILSFCNIFFFLTISLLSHGPTVGSENRVISSLNGSFSVGLMKK